MRLTPWNSAIPRACAIGEANCQVSLTKKVSLHQSQSSYRSQICREKGFRQTKLYRATIMTNGVNLRVLVFVLALSSVCVPNSVGFAANARHILYSQVRLVYRDYIAVGPNIQVDQDP